MSLLLSIDTAGSDCAVALSTDKDLLSFRVIREPRMHSARLVPLIQEVLHEARCQTSDVAAVAVSKGPGSYTGLRIGVSTAKGLAFGLDIPLIGVATFEALAFANQALEVGYLVTTAPSRRNEAYWQVWKVDPVVPVGVPAAVLVAVSEPRSDTFEQISDNLRQIDSRVILVGENAETLKETLAHAGFGAASVAVDSERAAIFGVSDLGHQALVAGEVEDVATFEPYYLMEFVARKGGSPFDRLPF